MAWERSLQRKLINQMHPHNLVPSPAFEAGEGKS